MNERVASIDTPPQTGPVHIFVEGEMMIHALPKEVWPYVLDYGSWQNFTTLRHISGEPGQEGEVVALEKEAGGHIFKLYNARTIKLEPGRRIIWKTYREEAGGGEQVQPALGFGIVEFKICEAQGGTNFFWKCLYEYLVPYKHENELGAFRKQQSEIIDKALEELFPKLKALAERGQVGA